MKNVIDTDRCVQHLWHELENSRETKRQKNELVDPNRYIPRSRFERNKVLEWLRVVMTGGLRRGLCSRHLAGDHNERQLLGAKTPINYGDEALMQSKNIGFYTSELMKGKWDGYYKYRNHLMWQDDSSSEYQKIPMLHPDSYDTIYKKFEEISMMPTVYETGGNLEYKQDNYVHVDPNVLNNK